MPSRRRHKTTATVTAKEVRLEALRDERARMAKADREKSRLPAPTTFRSPDGRTRIRNRPRKYTANMARIICTEIMQGKTLREICAKQGRPDINTVIKWLANAELSDFREMYYYARRVQAEIIIDDILTIADDSENDWLEVRNKDGEVTGYKPDNEAIQRSRVRIDTRKWLAAKMLPRVYGDHLEVNHSATGDLAKLLQEVSNKSTGLPTPIDGEYEYYEADMGEDEDDGN